MTERQTGRKREPRPEGRFLSQVVSENLRGCRLLSRLSQDDVADRMQALGHLSWRRPTVSQVERGQRSLSIDELFALAQALETTVVKLLDPAGVTGDDDLGVDLGGGGGAVDPDDARLLVLNSEDPWGTRAPYGLKWTEDNEIKSVTFSTTEGMKHAAREITKAMGGTVKEVEGKES